MTPILAHRGTESGIEKGPTLHVKPGISILRKIMTKLAREVKILGPRGEARGSPEGVLLGPGGSQEAPGAILGSWLSKPKAFLALKLGAMVS